VCRDAGQVTGPACCVAERDIVRYGDASPDLMYCADVLVDAFADAKLLQIIRDGRDVVAAMLADPLTLSWFKPGMANVETEFPNPFFGIETEHDLAIWPELSTAGKCAMRWRGSVRAMAKLRSALSAEQLTTLRYENAVRHPAATAAAATRPTPHFLPHLLIDMVSSVRWLSAIPACADRADRAARRPARWRTGR